VARSQSSSDPSDFSGGRVESLAWKSSKPKARRTDSTKSSRLASSSGSCSGVTKMWLSSCVKPRMRNNPCRVPDRSYRYTVPSSNNR